MIWGGQTHHLRKHPAFLVPQLEPCRRLVRLDVPWPFLSCGSGAPTSMGIRTVVRRFREVVVVSKNHGSTCLAVLMHEFSHQIWTVDPLLRKLFTRGMGHRKFSQKFGNFARRNRGHNSWTETIGGAKSLEHFHGFFFGGLENVQFCDLQNLKIDSKKKSNIYVVATENRLNKNVHTRTSN